MEFLKGIYWLERQVLKGKSEVKRVSKAYGVVICVGCVNRDRNKEQLELIRKGNEIRFPSMSLNS